ncbi:hypothetical protein Cob_v008669 [Colletotrichum orbiculare MAFF 240422]|uniref:Uncharacterized protein n=1 Tax=Colletotrichum orbiculare (strain 104-T / ATCC 96160 / CBS 514.97 / LARS 414 / MAFF 240422) TaxID=1213857 RepID=A0A484FKG7_COLOR|nr:hypothetical protein Cob_v008669 [Colletotrichum orbiculare MAFF 240422]
MLSSSYTEKHFATRHALLFPNKFGTGGKQRPQLPFRRSWPPDRPSPVYGVPDLPPASFEKLFIAYAC